MTVKVDQSSMPYRKHIIYIIARLFLTVRSFFVVWKMPGTFLFELFLSQTKGIFQHFFQQQLCGWMNFRAYPDEFSV